MIGRINQACPHCVLLYKWRDKLALEEAKSIKRLAVYHKYKPGKSGTKIIPVAMIYDHRATGMICRENILVAAGFEQCAQQLGALGFVHGLGLRVVADIGRAQIYAKVFAINKDMPIHKGLMGADAGLIAKK